MPKPDSILNDVIAGRVDQVLSAISQMQNGVSLRSGHKGKERQGTSSTPIAKRRKACVVGEDKSVGVRDCVRACSCCHLLAHHLNVGPVLCSQFWLL